MARYFPRAAQRRTAAVAVAFACVVTTATSSAQADRLHDKQHNVQRQVRNQTAFVDDSSKALVDAQDRLSSARRQLGQAQSRLQETEVRLRHAQQLDQAAAARLAAAERRLKDAQNAVVEARRRVHQKQQEIANIAVQSYQQGNPQLLGLAVMMRSSSPQTVTTQMQTVDNLVATQTEALAALRKAKVQLINREHRVSLARDSVAAERRLAAAHLVVRKQVEAEAASAQQQVVQLVSRRTSAANAAASQLRSSRRQLGNLESENRRIQQMILRKARESARTYHGHTNGILEWPADGPVTSPYGYRFNPVMHYWGLHDGIDIGAGCDQPERAVADGTVISEYYSPVWGHRLFLDLGQINGKNVTVIYNHISTYAVGSGAHVGRGQTVSYVGTTGWSTGCHLHFTVMVDGVAVNPMAWLG